ncbi:putative cyclin [Rosa chinensis]|uniref:B-like cyclin n=1 Tax=Rosa chinensis TaxID=74649 RepID=A0A2P6RLC9_ROSCH|nr:putative cyclin [Rosa chinensis]
MVISDENCTNLVRPTNVQGGVEMGNRKIGHNRRALGVINQSLIGAKPYPCVVNKRGFPGKHEICEKKQADPAHRPITRKFAAQIGSTQQLSQEEIKKPSDSFGDCIFIDEEFKSPEDQADQPEPMFLEQAETMPNEANVKEVEMEDIVEEPLVDIDSSDLKNPLAVVEYVEDLYTYYRKMEGFSCVPPDYLEQQFDINEKMRAILIDWLIEVHDKFELLDETLFLTVNLIDRFLSSKQW